MSASIGVVVGAIYLLVGLIFVSGALREALVAFGVCLPGLLMQDAWRNAFFARAAGVHAFLNDLLWAALLLPSMLVLISRDEQSVGWFVLVWGGAATVASLGGAFQARLIPKPQLMGVWWREHRDLTIRYMGEFMATQGAQQLSLYVISVFAGLTVLGSLRAAALLFGPPSILVAGLSMVAVPEGARLLSGSRIDRLNQLTTAMSAVLAAVTVAWGIVLYLIPSEFGTALVGETWDEAHRLIPALTVFVMGTAVAAGPMSGLKTLAAARRSFRARLWVSVLVVAGPFIGLVILGGAPGVAWGGAVAEIAGAAIWFAYYHWAVGDSLREKAHVPVPREGLEH